MAAVARRLLASVPLLVVLSVGRTAPADFVRGDVDANGSEEITDAIQVLLFLFAGVPNPPSCLDAADTNDDGSLDVSDAIYLLSFLFEGGNAPPFPFPICGGDPTDDLLTCESFPNCSNFTCGGFIGIPCPEGRYCELPVGLCCCDLAGVCLPIPEACPAIFEPVCGCDRQTYSNDCERMRAGVSKDHEGPCAQ